MWAFLSLRMYSSAGLKDNTWTVDLKLPILVNFVLSCSITFFFNFFLFLSSFLFLFALRFFLSHSFSFCLLFFVLVSRAKPYDIPEQVVWILVLLEGRIQLHAPDKMKVFTLPERICHQSKEAQVWLTPFFLN